VVARDRFVPEKLAPWRRYDDPRGAGSSSGGPFMLMDKEKARAIRNQQ
jgi:hypothetical protein